MKLRAVLSLFAAVCAGGSVAYGHEYLVRFQSHDQALRSQFVSREGGRLNLVSRAGVLYKWTTDGRANTTLVADQNNDLVRYVVNNGTLGIFESPSLTANRKALIQALAEGRIQDARAAATDNPAIKSVPSQASGADPLLKDAWGMDKVGAQEVWAKAAQGNGIVVAVTDTGVDYNHADLIANMWRNKNEIPDNGVDDDSNGFIDDIVGWDFASNDNKPYDLALDLMAILFQGGNPGHGTHVAGVVAARRNNSIGVSGVAPLAQIMAMRFITEKGQGTTENAIKAIDYAVANGANIINASWGGEKDSEPGDEALKEAIERAQAKGVLFLAAAGNGRANPAAGTSAGFNNDTDPKPMIPATLGLDNIVTVAATDSNDALAGFSNWGEKTVRLAAPGVKILSTVPGDKYQDTVVDIGSIKATWDGTSMATPFVAGSYAVIWSMNPGQSWEEVRDKLLGNVEAVSALSGKVVTGGRLNLRGLSR